MQRSKNIPSYCSSCHITGTKTTKLELKKFWYLHTLHFNCACSKVSKDVGHLYHKNNHSRYINIQAWTLSTLLPQIFKMYLTNMHVLPLFYIPHDTHTKELISFRQKTTQSKSTKATFWSNRIKADRILRLTFIKFLLISKLWLFSLLPFYLKLVRYFYDI